MQRSKYSSSELRIINQQNANVLPPATAVHGMAMYELQRHGEQERLFHAAMFNISQTTAAQQSRLDSLERRINVCDRHHDNERTVSVTCVRTIQDALDSFTPADTDPKAVIKRSNWLMNELDQETISTEDQVALTTVLTINDNRQAKIEFQEAVQRLRDDNLTASNDLLEVKNRLSKLEDIVRALTAQGGVAQTSPKKVQELEAVTRYGRTMIIRIPKGKPLVPLRSSRSQTPTLSNYGADSAPNSQLGDETMSGDGDDTSTSPQDTADVVTSPIKVKAEAMEEQPQTLISAAATSPVTRVAVKSEQRADEPHSKGFKPAPATTQDTSSRGNSPPSVTTPVRINSEIAQVEGTSFSVQRSAGEGNGNGRGSGMGSATGNDKKKWVDPPIFLDSQVLANEEKAETLLSFRDYEEAPCSYMSTIQDTTNQTMPVKPVEAKQESSAFKLNKQESFVETNRVDENQPPKAKPMQAKSTTALSGIWSTPGATEDMLMGIASETTSSKVPIATQENVIPRSPIASAAVAPSVSNCTASPAPFDVSQRLTFRRIAKDSVIRKKENSSIEQPAPAKTIEVTRPPQSSTLISDHTASPPLSSVSQTSALTTPRKIAKGSVVRKKEDASIEQPASAMTIEVTPPPHSSSLNLAGVRPSTHRQKSNALAASSTVSTLSSIYDHDDPAHSFHRQNARPMVASSAAAPQLLVTSPPAAGVASIATPSPYSSSLNLAGVRPSSHRQRSRFSSISSAVAPQSPVGLTVNAEVATPASARPIMSPSAPAFQPSGAFATNAPHATRPFAPNSGAPPAIDPFATLRTIVSPEFWVRYNAERQKENNVQQ